ncbi:unnamed protein product [Parnassius apollo]|uniref:(apollo) hypothetical protein n=1 Tax=Parnassius apollo TaxID=110799 RepID=A0A8S3XMC3_PARAO|nr:unnamed protein product [Parnassius apollo]
MDKKIVRKGPLPGGRRGASIAGAGRGSMRAASQARRAAWSPSSPPHPSSPPEGLVSAGSSRTQQAAPAAGGARRMRWSQAMNTNALRAYFRAKGEETGCLAYRARMHPLFAELEPSLTVTEQNLADRVRRPGTGIRAYEEYIGRGDCGNAQYASRKSTATSPQSPKQAESGCREGSEPNAGDLFGSQPGPLRDGLNFFGAALAACRIIGAKVSTAGRATGYSSAIPAWRRRIEKRIAKARALIGRLICFRSGNNRPRIVRTVRMAFAGTNVSLSQPDITQKLTERIDDLKQRIAAWGKRIRRYTERSTRFNQNRLFQSDQKRLYA